MKTPVLASLLTASAAWAVWASSWDACNARCKAEIADDRNAEVESFIHPGAVVSVSVNLDSGDCDVARAVGHGPQKCVQDQPCSITATRSWSGLQPGSFVEVCTTSPPESGERTCKNQRPVVGRSGAGSHVDEEATQISCGGEDVEFSVMGHPPGSTSAIKAWVVVSCSSCDPPPAGSSGGGESSTGKSQRGCTPARQGMPANPEPDSPRRRAAHAGPRRDRPAFLAADRALDRWTRRPPGGRLRQMLAALACRAIS